MFSYTAPNKRIFDVDVEGTAVNDIDVFQIAGQANRSITRLVTVDVNDGQLSIAFKVNVPKVTPILDARLLIDHGGLTSISCGRWTIPRSRVLR
jgi:Malectin domain